jgi:riboflavin synthase
MYTGIVEELGRVRTRSGNRIVIEARAVLEDITLGASLSVNGCCLTAVEFGDDWWAADVSDETLLRTCLDALSVGDVVNLERPVRLSDRLGGHVVQGHVDAVGTIVATPPELQIRIPQDLMRYVVEKGSVTVDGVSLTVVRPLEDGFTVAVIPHTASVTTLGHTRPGDPVNIEVDVLAKYVERLLAVPS